MAIDFEEMAALIELLKQLDFTDFRFEKGDLNIAVRRGGLIDDNSVTEVKQPLASDPVAAKATPARPPSPAPQLAVTARSPAILAAAPTSSPGDGDHIVTAPLLGTIYCSPKPGESPFVTIGATVTADDPLCVIEVMKLFNSVTAGVSGVVTAILASDGQLVEFGQPLFAIRAES